MVPLDTILSGYKKYLGSDSIKQRVCAYYKLDPFKEDKPFEQWVQMYLSMIMVETDDIMHVWKPLAELSGELAGGFFNPEGLKQYYAEKEKLLHTQNKTGTFKTGSEGGMAISSTEFRNGKIVDKSTGDEVISMEELANFFKKQGNL